MSNKAPSVVAKIRDEAEVVDDRIQRRLKPQMKLPIRSLSNVSYKPREGFFQLRGRNNICTLSVSTVKTFAQTLKFTDGDPYGYFNIYRTMRVGSGNAAHLNEFFCVPRARFLGVTPDEIVLYDLPTHPLKDVDRERAADAMKNAPFTRHYKQWQNAVKKMLKKGVRVEQQALAKHGLEYVARTYLPGKLKKVDAFLP